MKKVFTLVSVLLVLAMFLGACAQTPVAEPPATSAEPLRVAVVSPSSINDLAFTQSISDALKVLKTEMGDRSGCKPASVTSLRRWRAH